MTHRKNPLAVTDRQKRSLADGAIRLYLTPRQTEHLQTGGLLAQSDTYWRHDEGSFMLMPRGNREARRQRVDLLSMRAA